MRDEQKLCKASMEKYQLSNIPEVRLLDAISEFGELSKEILNSSQYGSTSCSPTEEISDEMGDCLFALLCLCNSLNINADDALQHALKKYETRFAEKKDISSSR